MAKNEEEMFTETLNQRLFNLDQSIPVPPMPDVSLLFERLTETGNKKNNIRLFPMLKTAAVACICLAVLIPMLKSGVGARSASPQAAEDANMLAMGSPASYDGGAEEEYAADTAPRESPEMAYQEAAPAAGESAKAYGRGESGDSASVTCETNAPEGETGAAPSALELLAGYFAAGGKEVAAETKDAEQVYDTGKRRVEISPTGDSVSVLVYDSSGQAELLSGFWVEGGYVSSDLSGDGRTCTVVAAKAVSAAEVEAGDFMPQTGDLSGYPRELLAESITVPGAVVPRVTMTAVIDLYSGEYAISAELR